MSHIEGLEGRQLFAGGTIDAGYGTAGTTAVAFKTAATDVSDPQQIAVDSEGLAYVATRTRGGTFQVRRLAADGSVDTAWAAKHKGLLLFTIDTTKTRRAQIVVDRSDRLDVLLNGQVQRFSTDGTADAAFGEKGTLDLSNFSAVSGIAVDASNKLWVSGDVATGPKSARSTELQVVRYRSAGKTDPTFQTNGVYQAPAKPQANKTVASSGGLVSVLRDGSVLVIDRNATQATSPDSGSFATGLTYAIKFNADGTLDSNYGTRGVSKTIPSSLNDNGGRSVDVAGVRSDGTVIVNVIDASNTISDPQYDYSNLLIAPNGRTAYQQNLGQSSSAPDSDDGVTVRNVVTEPDGGVLLSDDNGNLFRDEYGFEYDRTFNGNKQIGYAQSAALLPDGALLTFGNTGGKNNAQVTRYYADDTLVTDFSAHTQRVEVSSVQFRVTYKAAAGVDTATLGGAGLRVIGESGKCRPPRLVEVVDDGFGNATATYKVTALDGHDFHADDDGTYAVRLLDGFVKDKNGTAAAKRTLGTFTVAIK